MPLKPEGICVSILAIIQSNFKEKQRETQPKVEKSYKPSWDNNKPRKLSSKEKREFETLEANIAQMEAEKAEAEKALYNAPPGAVTQVRQLYEQVETLTQAIETATERWLELAEIAS